MNENPTANDTCACDRCECNISGANTVQRGDRTFCSEGCADGNGCDHEVCMCSEK